MRGHRNDRQVGSPKLVADTLHRLDAVDAGQADVHDDEVGLELADGLKREIAGTDRFDPVTGIGQHGGRDQTRGVIILDHQDVAGRRLGLAAALALFGREFRDFRFAQRHVEGEGAALSGL